MTKHYAVYNQNDELVFEGTGLQAAEYLNMTYASFLATVSKIKRGLYKSFKGGYQVYEVEE